MKYMGSKNRHAKEILPIMLASRKDGQAWVEPFVGGANVLDKVDGFRVGNDNHRHLIEMWKAVANGWMPDQFDISEKEYKLAQAASVSNFDPKIGYTGFALSYGGKWFGGYRRDSIGKRDYSQEAYRDAAKQFPKLAGVVFNHGDYRQTPMPSNSLVYCDPPYLGTTRYKNGIDHDEFWAWCDGLVERGHTVFVSEYAAPDHWQCVWSKTVNNTLTKDTGSKQGTERLFTRAKHG
jgi:DNA adenine methylase